MDTPRVTRSTKHRGTENVDSTNRDEATPARTRRRGTLKSGPANNASPDTSMKEVEPIATIRRRGKHAAAAEASPALNSRRALNSLPAVQHFSNESSLTYAAQQQPNTPNFSEIQTQSPSYIGNYEASASRHSSTTASTEKSRPSHHSLFIVVILVVAAFTIYCFPILRNKMMSHLKIFGKRQQLSSDISPLATSTDQHLMPEGVHNALKEQLERLKEVEENIKAEREADAKWKEQVQSQVLEYAASQILKIQREAVPTDSTELSSLNEKIQTFSEELTRQHDAFRREMKAVPTVDDVKKMLYQVEKSAMENSSGGAVRKGGKKIREPSNGYMTKLLIEPETLSLENLFYVYQQLWKDVHLGSTGVRNWAQETLGASIISTYTVKGINESSWFESVLRFFTTMTDAGRWRGTAKPITKPADVVLKPTGFVAPGDCFAFAEKSGNITIHLPRAVYISSVAIEHVMPEFVDPSTAPKRFSVFGWPAVTYETTDSTTNNISKGASKFGQKIRLSEEEEFIFDYPNLRLQRFQTKIPKSNKCIKDSEKDDNSDCHHPIPMRRITFSFLENYGGPRTSIYRLRVHGDPVVVETEKK